MAITKRPLDPKAAAHSGRGEHRRCGWHHLPTATTVPTDTAVQVHDTEVVTPTVTVTPSLLHQDHLPTHPSSSSSSPLPSSSSSPSPGRTLVTPLEALPKEIIDEISRYLPYKTLINMQWSSPVLWKKVDTQLAPYESRVSFVLRAESEFARHQRGYQDRNKGSRERQGRASVTDSNGYYNFDRHDDDPLNRDFNNSGCYVCFRVLRTSRFENLNKLKLRENVPVDMRRFCILGEQFA